MNRFFVRWNKFRASKSIKGRLLFDEKARGELQTLPESNPLAEVKYLPTEVTTPAAVNVFEDRTIIFPAETEKDPLLIVINNKEVAESFRAQFEMWWNQDVKVYKGFGAVTERFAAMRDELKKGEAYSVLGATYGKGGKKLVAWFKEHHRKRAAKGVTAKLLTVSRDYEQVRQTLHPSTDPEMKYGEIKCLPLEFSSPMQITMYKGNKVLMLLFGKEMVCFEIESKVLHNNFKTYFDLLWEIARK